ncbi:MAG: hypothetical protein K2H95_09955, partial [Bacteroidales bacterium]|nr:hypothetical protein [Bacteroidales bacterium]
PNPLNEATKNPHNQHLESLETAMPGFMPNLTASASTLRSTSATCRTLSSQSRTASSGCSSAA